MNAPTSIKELQQRLANNDETAYKELFFLVYQPLVQFARTLVHHPELAEEIVSEILIRIWETRENILSIRNLRVYLYVSVRHASHRYLRDARQHDSIDFNNLDVDIPATDLDPEQLLITEEMRRRIDDAIRALPPRCKLVYKLVRQDGLPYREVAEILNISIKTIDNQLAIALKKISTAISLDLRGSRKF